jgi:lipoprotein-anchoring transpeptidase ErfK/SrfK
MSRRTARPARPRTIMGMAILAGSVLAAGAAATASAAAPPPPGLPAPDASAAAPPPPGLPAPDAAAAAPPPPGLPAPDASASADPPPARQQMRLEISLGARELYEYLDDELVRTYPVAVGQPGHETPTGSWGIHQVDWNPDWTPPDSEWAESADYTPPGHPDNPMGRVRLIYRAPYSIHGTEELESLGRAASRGSVRMANDDIIELARRVMEHGGVARPEVWFEDVLADPTEMREVPLPNPVPLTNRP